MPPVRRLLLLGRRPACLTSAAEALIAATNAVSWAGVLTAAAILLSSSITRTASFFGPVVGTVGMVAGALGVVSEAARPVIGPGYLLYGLLLPIWFALVGWKLLHLDPDPTGSIEGADDEQ